jgi:hypothetical protein
VILVRPRFCFVGCNGLVPRSVLVASISTRLSEAELEQLYAGFVRLARLDGTELAALLEHVLADGELGSS